MASEQAIDPEFSVLPMEGIDIPNHKICRNSRQRGPILGNVTLAYDCNGRPSVSQEPEVCKD